jgi:adenylylsulfate kinase
MKEKKKIFKTITWRIAATSTTLLIVYLLTGKLQLAGSAAVVEVIAKSIIYYVHETAWDNYEFIVDS